MLVHLNVRSHTASNYCTRMVVLNALGELLKNHRVKANYIRLSWVVPSIYLYSLL